MYKRDEIMNKIFKREEIINRNATFIEDYNKFDHQFDIKLMGDHGVGRSFFLWRLVNGEKPLPKYISSVDHFVHNKMTTVDMKNNSKVRVKLRIFDIGKELFKPAPESSKGLMPLILFYDPEDMISYNNLNYLLTLEKKKWELGKEPIAILALTKSDLISEPDLPKHLDRAKELLKAYPNIIGVTTVSAQNSSNIELTIEELARALVANKTLALKSINNATPQSMVKSSTEIVRNNPVPKSTVTQVEKPSATSSSADVSKVSRDVLVQQQRNTNVTTPTFLNFVYSEFKNQISKVAPYMIMDNEERKKHIVTILGERRIEYINHYCEEGKNIRRLNELLVAGGDVNRFDGSQVSAVELFINDAAALKMIIDLVDVKKDPSSKCILAQSIITISEEKAKNSLQRAAAIPRNSKVITLLVETAKKMESEYKEFAGFINFQDKINRNTAAHYAVKAACMENFTVLYALNADITIKAEGGRTAPDMICYIPVEEEELDRNHKFVRAFLNSPIGSELFMQRYGATWASMFSLEDLIISMEILVRLTGDAKPQCFIFSECVKLLSSSKLNHSEATVILAMLDYVEYLSLDLNRLSQDSDNANCIIYLGGHLAFANAFSGESKQTYMRASILAELTKDSNIDLSINKLVFDKLEALLRMPETENIVCESVVTQLPAHVLTESQQEKIQDIIKEKTLFRLNQIKI